MVADNAHSIDQANFLTSYISSLCTVDDGLTPDVAQLVYEADLIDNILFSSVLVTRALRKVSRHKTKLIT